jgi:hypothetical protein
LLGSRKWRKCRKKQWKRKRLRQARVLQAMGWRLDFSLRAMKATQKDFMQARDATRYVFLARSLTTRHQTTGDGSGGKRKETMRGGRYSGHRTDRTALWEVRQAGQLPGFWIM